jgi:hypothetical protein
MPFINIKVRCDMNSEIILRPARVQIRVMIAMIAVGVTALAEHVVVGEAHWWVACNAGAIVYMLGNDLVKREKHE